MQNTTFAPSKGNAQHVDLDRVQADPAWVHRISQSQAKQLRSVPLCVIEDHLVVATCNPSTAKVEAFFQQRFDYPCDLVIVDQPAFRRWIARWFHAPTSQNSGSKTGRLGQSGASSHEQGAIRQSDAILSAGILRSASDIHLLPMEADASIQFRVDGLLEDYQRISSSELVQLTNRFKIISGMDIAEKRQPQDGRFSIGETGDKTEIRAATIPSRFGEKVTMRLLRQSTTPTDVSDLGMMDQERSPLDKAIRRTNGLILITGPTGSGKSTTLYAAIMQLVNSVGGNLITIEDPIEYEIPGATQVAVDQAEKVSFSRVLRSILRHDPDTIMLGEIRDSETAELAIKAAMTGHLVFSTLHTNSAAGAIPRLLDLGVDPYLIADTLRVVLAQRLVRRLCPECRQETPCSAAMDLPAVLEPLRGTKTFSPRGCVYCTGRGYTGRTALYESLRIDQDLQELISSRPTEAAIVSQAKRSGFRTLAECGIEQVRQGQTSLEQVTQVTGGW